MFDSPIRIAYNDVVDRFESALSDSGVDLGRVLRLEVNERDLFLYRDFLRVWGAGVPEGRRLMFMGVPVVGFKGSGIRVVEKSCYQW